MSTSANIVIYYSKRLILANFIKRDLYKLHFYSFYLLSFLPIFFIFL